MNQEAINELKKLGFLVPDHFSNNNMVLLKAKSMDGLKFHCDNIRNHGNKIPVVLFNDGFNSVWIKENYGVKYERIHK